MSFDRRDFFKNRFDVAELKALLNAAGIEPRDVISTRSKAYRSQPDVFSVMDNDSLLRAMVDEPTLIRRPLIVADDAVRTGFDRAGLTSIVNRDNGIE